MPNSLSPLEWGSFFACGYWFRILLAIASLAVTWSPFAPLHIILVKNISDFQTGQDLIDYYTETDFLAEMKKYAQSLSTANYVFIGLVCVAIIAAFIANAHGIKIKTKAYEFPENKGKKLSYTDARNFLKSHGVQ